MGVRINIYSVELVRESAKVYELDKSVLSPLEAYHTIEKVLSLSTKSKENFVMASLNLKCEVVGLHTVHVGSLNATVVHPREVLQLAILNNAASIMVFHNHPSGDPTPSPQDIEVTKRLTMACDIMGIELLDHIIIGDGRFISLKEKGYM